jgi:hypothetical protein
MRVMDTVKDAANATGEKVQRTAHDTADRASDKLDEFQAEGDVKKAEADLESKKHERDAVESKNEYKEDLRS